MRWLEITREPAFLSCAYCGQSGNFSHFKSYEHSNDTLSLHECSNCKSLIYDLRDVDVPLAPRVDPPGPEIPREARYVIETGFSSYFVAKCALSALPDMPEGELRKRVFVDVGAGMGMASYFVKTLFGMQTVTVEPSFTGKLSREILGLDVHRAYFEDLPKEVLAELANKPCFLQLNSVVEHLVDPAAVLADMIRRTNVEVFAAVVPDGAAIDFDGPFLNAQPFLAPKNHRHLPTRLGMELFLKRLGFEHVSVEASAGQLTATGSRLPIRTPGEREVKLAEHLFLEHLLRHPNPLVSSGGASRLLPSAILNNDAPQLARLSRHLPFEQNSAGILASVRGRCWDDIPFHLGQTCYWLAYQATKEGRRAAGLALLQITEAFADAIAENYPHMAMTQLEYKWAAMFMESHILAARGEFAEAAAPLRNILESGSNPLHGARVQHLRRAEAELAALKEKSEKSRPKDKLEHNSSA